MSRNDPQGCLAVVGLEHFVSLRLQGFTDQLAHRFFVLDQQHGFRAAVLRQRSSQRTHGFQGIFNPRQIDPEGRALPRFALNQDIAATLLDDAVHGRKSQSSTFSFLLGGEKWLEDAQLGFFVHALAGISYREHDVKTRVNVGVFAANVLMVQSGVGALNSDFSTIRHGVFGIDHQIHEDLLDLAGIGAGSAEIGCELRLQLDVLSDQRTQQALYLLHDEVQVYNLQFQQLLPAERQELASQGGGPISRLVNRLDLRIQGIVFPGVLEQDFRITTDYHQQIVEIMGHPPRQTSHRFHLLSLAKLVLQHAPLRDIFSDNLHNLGSLLRVVNHAATQAHCNRASILALPADFHIV